MNKLFNFKGLPQLNLKANEDHSQSNNSLIAAEYSFSLSSSMQFDLNAAESQQGFCFNSNEVDIDLSDVIDFFIDSFSEL